MTNARTNRDIDFDQLRAQIGRGNLMAISGFRMYRDANYTVTLPVSNGYSVNIELAGNDTYTVRRIFKRGAKTWVKGERTGVYCDEIGEVAYYASCFRSHDAF